MKQSKKTYVKPEIKKHKPLKLATGYSSPYTYYY